MATTNKDFRVKNGLIIEGTTATLNGENLATEDYVDNALGSATGDFVALADVGEPGGVASLDENGQVPVGQLGNVSASGLPSQSGNAGKYLTTDGTTASWAPAATETPHPFSVMG